MVKADPGDDGELRKHTGRHWRNVEKYVEHPNFEELNGGLKEIDPGANLLIVCFCNQGRHRSVAEKEMLCELFKQKWFGSRRGNVLPIDLQRKQWKKLCAPDCEDCDCKSRAFNKAIERGISRITDYIPTRRMHNPMWPGGVPPRARAQVKEEVKDDEELPAGSQRGEKKIRVLDGPKPKVKVDKKISDEELKAKLVRRKEQFAAGRQCGKED